MDIITKVIIGVAIAAITGAYRFAANYVSRKKRLIYGLYVEMLSNYDMLDSCINFQKDITKQNVPRIKTDYYDTEFSKSSWIKFFNRVKPLRIPDNIKSSDVIKRHERLQSRSFVSSVHFLYSRIRILNYAGIDSTADKRSFNKNFVFKSRVKSIRHDLFILMYNLEKSFKYLGEHTL